MADQPATPDQTPTLIEPRDFPLHAVLTIVTETMLSEEINEAWKVQEHIVGRPLLTHQQAGALHEIAVAALVIQYPALDRVKAPAPGVVTDAATAAAWVAAVADSLDLPSPITIRRPAP